MGRNPKPTALLAYEKGTLYSDQRDRSEMEPQPRKHLTPKCPKRFTSAERRAWRELSTILKNYGLFTVANAVQLELLATAWAQYVEVCEKFSENPNIIVKGPQGGFMYNPYFDAQHKLAKVVDKYCQNLGLSSLAMAKIGSAMLGAKKKKSEMEDLLD